jgi:putative FmdB family regulatory protein
MARPPVQAKQRKAVCLTGGRSSLIWAKPEQAMPTYSYLCDACGKSFEKEQRISEDALKTCVLCGKDQAHRQIVSGNFILKGGGWYSDGYGSSKSKASAKSESSSSESSGKSEKSEKSESSTSASTKTEATKSESSSSSSSDAAKGGGSKTTAAS